MRNSRSITVGAEHKAGLTVRISFATQFCWVSGGKVAGAFVQALTLVLVARWAGPIGFGAVGIALSLVVAIQTITELGLPTYIVRERAAAPANPLIRQALRMSNVTSRSMAVALGAILLTLGATAQPLLFQLLPLSIWAAADRNTDTWLGVTLADGDVKINTLAGLSRRSGTVLLMTALNAAGIPPLLAFSFAATIVGLVVNQVVHHIVHRRLDSRVVPPEWRAILKAASVFWVSSAATQFRNVDTLIVGAIAGSTEVAYYAAASRVTGPLGILPASLAALLVPTAARAGVNNLRTIRTPSLIVVAMTLPIYGLVILGAPALIPWALGTDFSDAVLPIQIVCFGLVFAAIAAICAAVLQGIGAGMNVARISVLATGCCLLGILFGTAFLGSVGASIALTGSFILQSLGLIWVLRSRVKSAAKSRKLRSEAAELK